MDIEVGKQYVTLNGLIVKITERSTNKKDKYPVKGCLITNEDIHLSWTNDGKRFISSLSDKLDIKEEVYLTQQMLTDFIDKIHKNCSDKNSLM